jgi:hypothetical protein
MPAPSFAGISRAAVSKQWPVRIAAHTFSPTKRRFEPRALGNLEFSVPISWLLAPEHGAPLRQVILRDFDGDGKTDFACCTDASTFGVWLSTEEGFQSSPDFTQEFEEDVDEIAFVEALSPFQSESVGIRAGGTLHVLRNASLVTPRAPLSVPALQ